VTEGKAKFLFSLKLSGPQKDSFYGISFNCILCPTADSTMNMHNLPDARTAQDYVQVVSFYCAL